ncbi:MAG: serine/threonine-protein kinase [Polyangiaceae bacterium]
MSRAGETQPFARGAAVLGAVLELGAAGLALVTLARARPPGVVAATLASSAAAALAAAALFVLVGTLEARPKARAPASIARIAIAALAVGLAAASAAVLWRTAPAPFVTIECVLALAALELAVFLRVRAARDRASDAAERDSAAAAQTSLETEIGPGTVIGGDFEIVAPLGAGGMGTVWVALQLSTQRRRALKILNALSTDTKAQRRFAVEAQASSRVRSPHVVDVVSAGVDLATRARFIVMELLQGEDLRAHVTRAGPLSRGEARAVFSALAEGLAAAHASLVVHRDLKPENVFLAEVEGTGDPPAIVVKLLDFGIAKWIADANASLTGAVGTPLWMAPEQLELHYVAHPSSDVWSFGLLVFWGLVGREYWRSTSGLTLLNEVGQGAVVPASQRASEHGAPGVLPDGFDAWFAKCLALRPEERFDQARKAFDELAVLLGDTTSSVIRESRRRDPSRDARLRPSDRAVTFATSQPRREPANRNTDAEVEPRDDASGAPPSTTQGDATFEPATENAARRRPTARRPRAPLALASVLVSTAALGTLLAVAGRARNPTTVAPPPVESSTPPPFVEPPPLPEFEPYPNRLSVGVRSAWELVRGGSFDAAVRELTISTGTGHASASEALWLSTWVPANSEASRDAYRDASTRRAELTPFELAVLEAEGPSYLTPPNFTTTEKAFAELWSNTHAPEAGLLLAKIRINLGNAAGAREVLDAIAGDWQVASLAQRVILEQRFLQTEPLFNAVRSCLALAPSAPTCLAASATIAARSGDCETMDREARAWIAADSADPRAYDLASLAAAARGADDATIRALFSQRAELLPARERQSATTGDELELDAFRGRFDVAAKRLQPLREMLEGSSSARLSFMVRLNAAAQLVTLARESGDDATLRTLSTKMLADVQATRLTTSAEVEQLMQLASEIALWGKANPGWEEITRATWSKYEGFVFAQGGAVVPDQRSNMWLFGYGLQVTTERAARDAVFAMPLYEPLPEPGAYNMVMDLVLGRVLVQAGQLERGTAYLRKAAASCSALDQPFVSIRAKRELAAVLEKQGDLRGARDALTSIVGQWGGAKPSSRTARDAKETLLRIEAALRKAH